MVATCGLLMIHVALDDLRTIREAGARGIDLVKYFLVTMPSFMALALPLVILISLLFVLGKLHRANELTAMRAAGVGFPRMMAAVWLVGILCCGLSWWLNASVVPWSVVQSRALQESFELKREEQQKNITGDRIGAIYSVGFDNPIDRRMWFFPSTATANLRVVPTESRFQNSMSAAGKRNASLLPRPGRTTSARGGWVFTNGRVITFDVDSDVKMASTVPFAELYVQKYDEQADLMLPLIDRRRRSTFRCTELGRLVDYFAVNNNPKGIPYAVRFYGLIADILGPLIVIGLAIPFAVTGMRVNPAVGVSKSIGLFMLYYVLENIAGSLAAKNIFGSGSSRPGFPISPWRGLGIWLFARIR